MVLVWRWTISTKIAKKGKSGSGLGVILDGKKWVWVGVTHTHQPYCPMTTTFFQHKNFINGFNFRYIHVLLCLQPGWAQVLVIHILIVESHIPYCCNCVFAWHAGQFR